LKLAQHTNKNPKIHPGPRSDWIACRCLFHGRAGNRLTAIDPENP